MYVSIEPPDVRMAAKGAPRGFIELYSPPVIFDEVQYAPELLPYIKEKIDTKRERYGQYLIAGSQNLRALVNRCVKVIQAAFLSVPLASLTITPSTKCFPA